MGICDFDVELQSTLNNLLALARGNVVSNLSRVTAVVHQQQLEVLRKELKSAIIIVYLDVVHNKLVESTGVLVTGLLVRSITNLGHGAGTLESSSDSVINTPGPSPGFLFV
jgi:hypothetical protein